MNELRKSEIIALIENSKTAYISSIDKQGYPNVKAMLSLQHDNIFTHYFSTNLSSRRAQQFLNNPKACVYFCDETNFRGLMLVGEMQVMTDDKHKTMLWRHGFEMYYPDGVATQDYCVLKFTAHRANYYHGLDNEDLVMEDF